MSSRRIVMVGNSIHFARLLLVAAISLVGQDWRSIVPAKTTRTEVERILGHVDTDYFARYQLPDGNLFIEYSSGPCRPGRKGGWNFPVNVVVSITFYPKVKPRLSDLKLNRKKLRRVADPHVGGIIYYLNDEDGIVYEIQEGRVDSIEYGPAKEYDYLQCDKLESPPKVH